MAKMEFKAKFKKAPWAPKRFKSGYMFYSEHQHKVIREKLGEKKIRAADAAKMVSKSWKELCAGERAKWLEMARLDRMRYEEEKAAYKGPWKVPDIKDPNAPKKPMSAFLAFGNERRRAIAKANPSMNNAEISTLLSKLWKECPSEVKRRYREREAHEREKFKQYRVNWERQMDQSLVGAAIAEDSSVESAAWHSRVQKGSFAPASLASIDDSEWGERDRIQNHDGEGIANFRQQFFPPLHMEQWDGRLSPHPHREYDYQPMFFNVETRRSTHTVNPTATGFSYANSAIVPSPSRKEGFRSKLEDYTLEELLQDDELFEDFSPLEVPVVPQLDCNSEFYQGDDSFSL